MSRLGFDAAGLRAAHRRLAARPGVATTTLMTHFANADLPDGARDPLEAPWPWYVLIELSSGEEQGEARHRIEAMLYEAIEAGEAGDAFLAQSEAQGEALWRMRTALSEVQKHEGGSIKHDVSVPVASIPDFLEKAAVRVEAAVPGARPVPFGHLGDGNLHYNISQPEGVDKDAFLTRWEEVNAVVHDLVGEFSGSISAEHGIGRMKRDLLPSVKSKVEMDMMGALKKTFDPNGILNPGKLL
jgi:FAD/FMN-containing dehydrogenase